MSIKKTINSQTSISTGLEKLSKQVLRSTIQEEETPLIGKQDIKEMQTLVKLTSYNSKDFHHKWAILIFWCNIYNLFTVGYFMGIKGFPGSFWLAFEICIEIIMLCDMLGRLVLRNSSEWSSMWMLHEPSTFRSWLRIILSSFPYSFFSFLLIEDLEMWWVAFLRAFKLLRLPQFSTFFKNQEIVRRSEGFSSIQILKLFLLLAGITHYSAMFWVGLARIENQLGEQNTWFEPYAEAQEYEVYVDACFWATSTLTSIGFGDLLPATYSEKVMSILVMVIGASVYGAIFGSIVAILEELNYKEVETQQKLEAAKQWSKLRKLDQPLKSRVLTYYTIVRNKFSHLLECEFIEELPLSLRTEISLFMHKEMIPKVKLFELGDPAFMMGIVRHLRPKLFMAGDYIVRQGDYCEEFYFVRVGTVEVLADDGETVIALLEEGAYFGEIGIFLQSTRSVSVRAKVATLTSSIQKSEFLSIMKNFPDYDCYLRKVAEQRLRTTEVEDIDLDYELDHSPNQEDSPDSPESFEVKSRGCLHRFITVVKTFLPGDIYIIEPLSRFYYAWSFALVVCYAYYLFLVPLGIAFEVDFGGVLLALDVVSYAVFLGDIVINRNTASLNEFGTYNHSKEEIKKNYLNYFFVLDFFSVIPADFIFMAAGSPQLVVACLKLLRFFKSFRVYKVIKLIQNYAPYSLALFKLFSYYFLLIILSHISACVFFLVAKIQYAVNSDERFDNRCFISAFGELEYHNYGKLLELSVFEQYIHMVYWGYSIMGTGAYGDFVAVTVSEKILNMILMVAAKFFIALIYAEASTVVFNINRPYTEHLTKLGLIKEWMVHIKLPHELEKRVLNYYNLLWKKLQGHNDQEIMKDLPESLRTDISCYLFKGLLKSGFFPEDDMGATLAIVKCCKVQMTCKTENVVSEGELGLNMYFILEGQAEIVLSNNLVVNTLSEGAVFGEMALLKPVPSVRGATVRAKTDLTLAVLSMEDFAFVIETYPDFGRKVMDQANKRERMNRQTLHRASVETFINMTRLNFVSDNENPDEDQSMIELPRKSNTVVPEEKINSFTAVDTENGFTPPKLKKKPSRFFLRFHNSKLRLGVYFVFLMYNFVFIPLQMAFEKDFNSAYLTMEVLSMGVYLAYTFYYFYLAKLLFSSKYETPKKLFRQFNKKLLVFKLLNQFLATIPFSLILWASGSSKPRMVIVVLSLLRVSNFYMGFEFWSYLKQYMRWFNVVRILEVVFLYLMTCHISACLWVEIAKVEAPPNSWLARIPSPRIGGLNQGEELSESTVFVHAFYWAVVTVSHIGTGDITAISLEEKIFTCLVFLNSCFIYAILFGNITSLVTAFASQLRSKLQESYNYVTDFINKKNIDKIFNKQINSYFNFLWHENKGIREKDVLKHIPPGMMADINLFRFSLAVQNSQVFKDKEGNIDTQLSRSIFRLLDIQYFLAGDVIVSANDSSKDIYIILDGKAQVVNLEGEKVIATLQSGAHFGEANILFDWTRKRTANVISTQISQIGILTAKKTEMLFDAFPEFHENLLKIATLRMQETFSSEDFEVIAKQFESISAQINKDPNSVKKAAKSTQKLLEPTIAEVLKEPPPNKWFFLSILHMCLLIYSAFMIPLQIGFDLEITGWLLGFEILCVTESLVYFLITCRYSIFMEARKQLEFRDILSYYYHHFLFEDVLAFSPFNVLFPAIGVFEPFFLITILRMLRLGALGRINSALEKIEIHSRNLSYQINIFKAVLFLIILTHWCSCFWFLVNLQEDSDSTWIDYNNLMEKSLLQKYIDSVYFTMGTVTSLGYGDMFPATDTERIVTCIVILIGDGLFAVAFGLMASAAASSRSEFSEFLENLKAPFSVLNKADVPQNIISRLETYYAFNTVLSQNIGPTNFKSLFEHLPPNIVRTITYECNKTTLKKVPLFWSANSEELIEKISIALNPRIYLTGDYIIYKNDIGEEMYFIMEGSVNVISPEGNKVIKELNKGDFVGEMALITDSRRSCSVIAKSLCLVYSLNKSEFNSILVEFPEVMAKIQEEGRARQIELDMNTEPAIPKRESGLFDTLSMYSAITSPFIEQRTKQKKISAYAGMQNMNSEVIIESCFDKEEESRPRRRPHVNGMERRLSQECLGKEIVLSRFSKLRMQWTMQGT